MKLFIWIGITSVISCFASQDRCALTLDQKIGQLFIIPACQIRGEDHFKDLEKLVREAKIGGVILNEGTAEAQRNLINRLQNLSALPLLCVQDGEWGMGMRLSDVLTFPRHLTLGAVQDLDLLFQFGQEIGRQCHLVGVHLNLAPVCDVNCTPSNPIIHMRSFGEDPIQVAVRSELVMRGIQSMGVLACAKHFPGHGDTVIDSHVDLPLLEHKWQRLQRVELFPFLCLIKAGVKAVMSAHLCVNSIVEEPLLPATFSKQVITDLLRNKFGFTGLVISDALNMKALTNNYSPSQIAVKVLLAGHDLLLYGDHIAPNVDQILRYDVPEAQAAIKACIEKGEISESFLDAKVEKILKIKQEMRLFEDAVNEPVENLIEKINSSEAKVLKKKLFQEAITVVRNTGLLPLKKRNIALIEWGEVPVFSDKINAPRLSLDDPELFKKVKEYSCLVISLVKFSTVVPNFGLDAHDANLLNELFNCHIPTVAVVFGTPYSLSRLPLFDAVIVAYEKEREAQEAALDILFGQLSPKGRLPVSAPPHFILGTGLGYDQ